MGDGQEFLKTATVQLYSRGKFFQRLRKIWVCEHKNAQFTYVLTFWIVFFQFFCWYLAYLVLQNFLTEILVSQKILLESLRWPCLAQHLKVL